MSNKKKVLFLLILVTNIAIVVGTITLNWNPATIAILFAIETFLGISRITVERLFTARPPDNTINPPTGLYDFTLWYEGLLDKRGYFQIHPKIPNIYPKNIPYVLRFWIAFVVIGGAAIPVLFGAITGRVDSSFILLIPIFILKHISIIAIWEATGIYKQASVVTVRRREIIYSGLVGCIAIVFIIPQSPDTVAAALILALVPKILFDFREAGIGPWPLTFDPTSNNTTEHIPMPANKPNYTFDTDNRALWSWASLYVSILYMLQIGSFVFMWSVLAIILLTSSTRILHSNSILILFLASYLIILLLSNYIIWLGNSNMEYRVYDDILIGYDNYLKEPQWVIHSEEITTIAKDSGFIVKILPFLKPSVIISQSSNENIRIRFLKNPEEFVDTLNKIERTHTEKFQKIK
ncbi:uncharacterized protein Nmag_3428 [Natrialba magadii ATCC 43099]|uniref:Uncharacterized protein n=2 Tax=Natrialba magadii (strain ATCC 43099 / DSM 3394 / CCM 3739 / CIP 104546 / IAM 13178 / JCM 8861 / NBRC 102185 / NCIMB 2190 / MS3) TaxID=547559 RepID=D3STB1_NATMM|nr:hypothetical protein [Natrialba magadii]ADD06978.1 uncharacterized protein Nmag_3428 [Natrialba magadii ATCC 43099]